ncbi:MAG: hypothetical protein JSS49_29780 [Planctomycetes bacterium]|nr:hypothetical protein [Planctomycetota bacterium]
MENRVQQILRAVDEILRRIQRWLNDAHAEPILPEDVGLAIRSALLVCDSGEVPDCCRDLAVVAVPRLELELLGYQQRDLGKFRPENGAPGPSFWAASKAVATVRAEADAPRTEQLEPVHVLVSQGVTYEQIARHIYGRRGVGPFLQSNGALNTALIEQEARQPGSVIPEDWVPPWHEETLQRRRRDLSLKLQAYDWQEVAKKYDDPATVEELLRDGAYIQQIERAKGVSREEALEMARAIGITPVDGPSYHPSSIDSFGTDTDDDEFDAATVADRQALKALVIEMYIKSDSTRRPYEIALELRQLGHQINANSVSALIGHWKRKNARSAVATSPSN